MTLEIEYESNGFAVGAPVTNGHSTLTTTWNELLWAALTVGRPNRHYVFKHGISSMYEALFRLSLVRMALEQAGPHAKRLRRTQAARTLDPSEKGAVNYFLGLTICKLFAERLLDAPWMLHLDVYRPMLNPVLRGRSRPDLVGQTTGGQWVALECKGRLSSPSSDAKEKVKQQAQRLVSVNGVAPHFQVGGISFFRADALRFYWVDPEADPNVKRPIKVNVAPETWRHYYVPILDLIRSQPGTFGRMQDAPILMEVKEADVQVGIRPLVLRALAAEHWAEARVRAGSVNTESSSLPYRLDGIAVVAGESWLRPFMEDAEAEA